MSRLGVLAGRRPRRGLGRVRTQTRRRSGRGISRRGPCSRGRTRRKLLPRGPRACGTRDACRQHARRLRGRRAKASGLCTAYSWFSRRHVVCRPKRRSRAERRVVAAARSARAPPRRRPRPSSSSPARRCAAARGCACLRSPVPSCSLRTRECVLNFGVTAEISENPKTRGEPKVLDAPEHHAPSRPHRTRPHPGARRSYRRG